MLYFNCDYNEGAHERIMAALMETNLEQTIGYGEDEYCQKASETIQGLCGTMPDVHFLVGGTQANLTVISAALRPHQSVLCAKQGHIHVHETGAVEACGHKIIPLESEDGKLRPAQIEAYVNDHYENAAHVHVTQPKMVYITNATELGTVYTKAELEALSEVCKELDLILFMDGARLGYGLASDQCDLDIPTISALCDVFYIGGTKQGALFGEAVVINHPVIRRDFRYLIKQKGGMLAKGRLLGIQFYELFRDGLYFDLARQANALADQMREALLDCGYPIPVDGGTNQIFVVLPDGVLEKMSKHYFCEYDHEVDDAHSMVRFCTSWATKPEHVEQFIADLRRIAKEA